MSREQHEQLPRLFSVEDTADLCYRDVTAALERRQWLPCSSSSSSGKRRSKFEKKLAISRPSQRPALLWTISEKALDFARLHPSQLVNHFQGMSALTTKSGVCELLRDMPWIGKDPREVSPR